MNNLEIENQYSLEEFYGYEFDMNSISYLISK